MYHSSVAGMLMKRMDSAVGAQSSIDHVIALLAAVLVDVHHGAEFFHAGKNGQFFGLHVFDAGGAQHGDGVGRNFLPMPPDLMLNVYFLKIERRG